LIHAVSMQRDAQQARHGQRHYGEHHQRIGEIKPIAWTVATRLMYTGQGLGNRLSLSLELDSDGFDDLLHQHHRLGNQVLHQRREIRVAMVKDAASTPWILALE